MSKPLAAVTNWIIARRYCPRCHRTFGVVYEQGTDEMRCPQCDGLVVETCGDDNA